MTVTTDYIARLRGLIDEIDKGNSGSKRGHPKYVCLIPSSVAVMLPALVEVVAALAKTHQDPKRGAAQGCELCAALARLRASVGEGGE